MIPFRLCCGKQHTGPLCPDGLVQCAVCFTRVLPAQLHVDDDGQRWDVCKRCEPDAGVPGSNA